MRYDGARLNCSRANAQTVWTCHLCDSYQEAYLLTIEALCFLLCPAENRAENTVFYRYGSKFEASELR